MIGLAVLCLNEYILSRKLLLRKQKQVNWHSTSCCNCLLPMLQEINLMEKLSFDRNIVQFYGAVLSAPAPMLVLEFMEGTSRLHFSSLSAIASTDAYQIWEPRLLFPAQSSKQNKPACIPVNPDHIWCWHLLTKKAHRFHNNVACQLVCY